MKLSEKLAGLIEQLNLTLGELRDAALEIERAVAGHEEEDLEEGEQEDPGFPFGEEAEEKPVCDGKTVPPRMLEALRQVAFYSEIDPIVMAAIQVHETGWYTSRLWREANNPGGMKYSPTTQRIGATQDGDFAAWPSWVDGVIAHAKFFAQSRYDGIRKTKDRRAQVLAIHEAGYAELSQEWLSIVNTLVDKIASSSSWRPSEHFSLQEVERTSTGLPNQLPDAYRANAKWVAVNILEPIRREHGPLKVSSWYRSTAVNAAVGGEVDSVHREALAVDLAGGRTLALWTAIRKSGVLQNPDVRVLVETAHYHVANLRHGEPKDRSGGQWLTGVAPTEFEVIP
jgi:hypothetical protein